MSKIGLFQKLDYFIKNKTKSLKLDFRKIDFEKENRDLRKRIERLEGAIELAKDLLRDVFGKDIDEKKL